MEWKTESIIEKAVELYTDKDVREFASKVSHEWWQVAMDMWNTLTEDEKKKYNQFIGFNDFSDNLMNILISVLLGLKRNGKLIYEEGNLFNEPHQNIEKIELDLTPTSLIYKLDIPECANYTFEVGKEGVVKIEEDIVQTGVYDGYNTSKLIYRITFDDNRIVEISADIHGIILHKQTITI